MNTTRTFETRAGTAFSKASPEDAINAYKMIWEALGDDPNDKGIQEVTPTSFVVSMRVAKTDDITDRRTIGSARATVVADPIDDGCEITISAVVTLDRRVGRRTLAKVNIMGMAEELAKSAASMGDTYFRLQQIQEQHRQKNAEAPEIV